MSEATPSPERTQQEQLLYEKTKAFAKEIPLLSWWHFISTFSVAFVLMAGTVVGSEGIPVDWWPLWARILCSVGFGLILIRLFILYHDHMHGAYMKNSMIAKVVMTLYGMLLMSPPSTWKRSHNFHHAKNMQPNTAQIGSYPIMSVEEWKNATRGQRFMYRLERHPITMASGYLTMFMYGHVIQPLIKSKQKSWDCILSPFLHIAFLTGLVLAFGWTGMLLAWLLPNILAAAIGAFLFYIQHNFPGMRLYGPGEWSALGAAMESTSNFAMPGILRWFTGNIGFHHIHHMNSRIPFYRLPETMAAIPELQQPKTVHLRVRDLYLSLSRHVWDREQQIMLSYRQVRERLRTMAQAHPA